MPLHYSYDAYQLLKHFIIQFHPPIAVTFPSRISEAIKGKELTAISKKEMEKKKDLKVILRYTNQQQLKSNDCFVKDEALRMKRPWEGGGGGDASSKKPNPIIFIISMLP